jgi:SNF family Na+-dependent transporter
MSKTYKREIASASLLVLYVFIGYTLYTLSVANALDAMVDLVSVLIIPTFAMLAAAFGIDSYFKQNPKTGNRAESTTEQ